MEALSRLIVSLLDLVEAECAQARRRLHDFALALGLILGGICVLLLGVFFLALGLDVLTVRLWGPLWGRFATGCACLLAGWGTLRLARRTAGR
jgi:hypothetical protein